MNERRSFWRLSGVSLGVFLVAVMILVVAQRWYVARNDLADNLLSLAGIVGTNASAAVVFGDENTAAETLASLGHYPAVIEAALLRKDGSRLAGYRAGAPKTAAAAAPLAATGAAADTPAVASLPAGGAAVFSWRDVRLAVPIELGGNVVGSVTIRASQRRLYVDLAQFVIGLVAIGTFAFLLARFASGQLRRRTRESEDKRLKAEAAQRESERRLRSVTDHLPVALFQLTDTGEAAPRFSYVSDGATALLGIAPERLLATGAAFFDAVGTDDGAALARQLHGGDRSDADAADVTTIAWLGRFARADGPVWIEIRGSRSVDAAGHTLVSGVMQDVSQLRRYQDEIEQSRARLQQLIAHRESVVDEVHKKIAVEIHDQLGQIITAALLHVRLLERSLPATDAAARELVKSIDDLLNDAYRSMKDIAVSLRPAVLNFGFVAAAEWLAERVLGVAGIAWRITTSEPPPSLDERQSVAFFRIIQESLTNCVRHAGARAVVISLAAADDQLVLEIADDGRGLAVAAGERETRFGVLGIRERAESLGGTATIANAPGGGTRVRVVVPRAAADQPKGL